MAKRKHSVNSLSEIDTEDDNGVSSEKQRKVNPSSETSFDMGFSPCEERDLNSSLLAKKIFQSDFDDLQKNCKGLTDDDLESTRTLLMPQRCHADGFQSPASSIQLTPSQTLKLSPCSASVPPNSSESNKIAKNLHFDLPDKLRKYLQKNYIRLKENLDPDSIADRFCELDIISDAERRKIGEAGFNDIKCDILIKLLARKLQKRDDAFVQKVRSAFTKENCLYLLNGVESEDIISKEYVQENVQTDSGAWKEKLIQFKEQGGDEIDPKQIIDKLLEKEVLEFDEHENIQDIQFKPDKLKYLIEYINKKTLKEFNNFVQVLDEEYPYLCDGLKTFERMDISPIPNDELPSADIVPMSIKTSNSVGQSKVSEIKLYLEGNGQDIEKMIVENYSSGSFEAMSEEMMELGATDIQNCEFSCIRLTLKLLSCQSEMRLYSILKDSPDQLTKILKHLFKKEHLRMMRERDIQLIKFKLEIKWPDDIITRDVIAENYCFLKEKIEPNKFVDLIKTSNASQHVLDFITSTEPRATRCNRFLLFLVNDENSPIHAFHGKLKEEHMDDILKVLMESRKEIISRMCSCQLTKSMIVKHFSELVHELRDMNVILEKFANFSGFDASVKAYFEELKSSQKTSSGVKEKQSVADKFLRKILDMSKSEVSEELCLLEEEVRKTDQGKMLLEHVLKKPPQTKDIVITTKDISRNRSFLKNQLEPRRFLGMLSDIDGIENTREIILSSSPKETRCMEFLGMLERNKVALEKFGPELERLHLSKIIEFLYDARTQGSEEFKICKADIERNSGFLQEELEPRNFLTMLRDIQGTDDDIEKILSSSPKRLRCSRFYMFLLNASEKDLEKFHSELKRRDMQHVIEFLINTRPGRFQDKTQLKETLLETYKNIIDEIEPKCLQNTFVERGVYTEKEFQKICSASSRRSRATSLLQDIIKGPVSKARCLMNALDAVGYISLVKLIRKEIDTHKRCPRLFKKARGITDGYVFEGQLQVEKLQGKIEETSSSLNCTLKLPSQIVETGKYVQDWLDKMDTNNGGTDPADCTLNVVAIEEENVLNCSPVKYFSPAKSKNCFSDMHTNQFCQDSFSIDNNCYQRLDEASSLFSKDRGSPSSASGIRIKSASTRRAMSTTSNDSTLIYSDTQTYGRNDDNSTVG